MMMLRELPAAFPTDDACREFLKSRRWPGGVACPRCGKRETVYALANKPWHWECSNSTCRKGNAYRFSLLVGTIFENTKYPLRTWFEVLYMMLNSKKGISSKQIERQIGCSYPTALYMTHRLRSGMRDPDFKRLMGIVEVEVDEASIAGTDKNRHPGQRRGGSDKMTVVGATSRKGNVVCKLIERADKQTLMGLVMGTVSDKVELVATGEHAGYGPLARNGISPQDGESLAS